MQLYQAKNSAQPSKKNNKKWIISVIVVVFIISVIAIGYFLCSPFFLIKKIEIIGASEYSKEKYLKDFKDFFISHSKLATILGEENIFSWSKEAEDYLEIHPELAGLKINKNYFKKEILINISEREKFGIWCLDLPKEPAENIDLSNNSEFVLENETIMEGDIVSENKCFWFDKNGILFQETAFIESEIFKKVEDFSGRKLQTGNEVLPMRLFSNMLKIFEVLNQIELNSKTLKLKDLTLEEIYVNSVSDPELLFSLRINPEFSLAAIESLKKSGQWQKISYIDFRVENKVYYK